MLDETAEGNLFAALRTREADLDKHLQSAQGAAAEGRRLADRRRPRSSSSVPRDKLVEPANAATRDGPRRTPAHAGLNQPGKQVIVSKTAVERKADSENTN